jgi:hypothetical protein
MYDPHVMAPTFSAQWGAACFGTNAPISPLS